MRSAMMSTPTIPVLVARIGELRRDLISAHVRNRTFMRLLREAAGAPTIVGVLKGPHSECDEVVFLSNGLRIEHQWDKTTGTWSYVEAGRIPGTPAAIVGDALIGAPLEMDVAGTDDDAPLPVSLIARLEAQL